MRGGNSGLTAVGPYIFSHSVAFGTSIINAGLHVLRWGKPFEESPVLRSTLLSIFGAMKTNETVDTFTNNTVWESATTMTMHSGLALMSHDIDIVRLPLVICYMGIAIVSAVWVYRIVGYIQFWKSTIHKGEDSLQSWTVTAAALMPFVEMGFNSQGDAQNVWPVVAFANYFSEKLLFRKRILRLVEQDRERQKILQDVSILLMLQTLRTTTRNCFNLWHEVGREVSGQEITTTLSWQRQVARWQCEVAKKQITFDLFRGALAERQQITGPPAHISDMVAHLDWRSPVSRGGGAILSLSL